MIRIARTIAATPLWLVIAMTSMAGSAFAQTQLFEVEKSDATKLLQVQDDAGLVVKGAFDAGAIPATGGGVRLMWYPRKAALRAGVVDGAQWDDANIGQWSMSLGRNTTASGTHSLALNADATASGDRSVAMGGGTLASGDMSTAMGQATTASGFGSVATGSATTASGAYSVAAGRSSVASGQSSIAAGEGVLASGNFSVALGFGTRATAERTFAMGDNTTASGTWATAMGLQTVASGAASTAFGDQTTASGLTSVALGFHVSAGDGSFVFGDRSSSEVQSAGVNQFLVRAYGGTGFNSAPNIGCDLPSGEGAWACTSSRLAKEGFEDVDGEAVLTKLAGIRIQSWRYIGTGAVHMGPTAEDFRAAFGLGEGSTKIATVDADGIALRAAQALEARTAALQAENADLRADLAELRAELAALRDGLQASADAPPRSK